ncbi:RagB/SusD family nutrient uptake outer membrane protein [Croceitalea rosinachiae]|uniref:RagB/SusD family nutrient uptake outer membrane protein n=1 Tax=Croceitalea rosinachiae TaxID=3075596 RepID=A0ABU3AEF4_9FLAO|nr:RagB/SusD family nutrient uptake outer membrane protein [Croceitalea sp. F388]MDT0608180.1 RagB/SusD family nutrient uptake outer membrane protein [Croceitalea sp. F388]
MKFIKNILLMMFFIGTISCEKELDLQPQQSISIDAATATPENINAILLEAYDIGRNTSPDNVAPLYSGNYSGEINVAVDLLGNTDQVSWNGTFSNLRDLFNKAMINDNASALNIYADSYSIIGHVNTVLDNLDKFEDATESNRVEGEAKFLRGLVYFDMVRLYGQQYNAAGNNTQLGVPIVLLPPDVSRAVPRDTVEDVYAQVITDLNDAVSLLPDSNGLRADRYAAMAVLARVYLQQGNFAGARDAANDVLQNSGHALTATYTEAFDTDDNPNETIFSWVVNVQEGSNNSNLYYATQALGGRGGDIAIEPGYLDKFDSLTDERRNFTYPGEGVSDGFTLTSKFARQFANATHIRIAEMHLIRAECNFRLATAIGLSPLDEINALRARSSAPALTALTLGLILNERELELAFEGFLLHDYKRTERDIGGLPFNDNRLVFPIPQSARDRNPLLDQNPGYN